MSTTGLPVRFASPVETVREEPKKALPVKIEPYIQGPNETVTADIMAELVSVQGYGVNPETAYYDDRAMIIPLDLGVVIIRSMGLNPRGVEQIHADGEPINPSTRNTRLGWRRPTNELIKTPAHRLDKPALVMGRQDRATLQNPVDFEKSEISARFIYFHRETDSILRQLVGAGLRPTEELGLEIAQTVLAQLPRLYE